MRTPYYALDIFESFQDITDLTNDSFIHLYVRSGAVDIKVGEILINVTCGHSCFIPAGVQKYTIHAKTIDAAVLKTYVS